MKKIDPVVMKETMRILIGSIVLGAIMNAVFLMLRCWNLPVLFGTLLGAQLFSYGANRFPQRDPSAG